MGRDRFLPRQDETRHGFKTRNPFKKKRDIDMVCVKTIQEIQCSKISNSRQFRDCYFVVETRREFKIFENVETRQDNFLILVLSWREISQEVEFLIL